MGLDLKGLYDCNKFDNKHLKASEKIEDIYSSLINEFENNADYKGFKRYNRIKTNKKYHAAGIIYRHLPAHFFKAQDIILRHDINNSSLTTAILKQKRINIVDIGAGAGTFLLALINLLIKKKDENENGKNENEKIVLNYIAIEPVKLYNQYIDFFIEKINKQVKEVHIKYEIINKAFPYPTFVEDIKANLENDSYLVLSMSNIINWLDKSKISNWDNNCSKFKNYIKKAGKIIENLINQKEKQHPFLNLIEQTNCNHVTILANETKGLETKDMDHLKSFQDSIKNRALYDITEVKKFEVTYINIKNSHWRSKMGKKYYTNNYLGYYIDYNNVIDKMANENILEKAYFKVRFYNRRIEYYDETLLKLYENNLNKYLTGLSKKIREGYEFKKNYIEYPYPKNENDSRPLVMMDLEEEIVLVSLLIVLGVELDSYLDENEKICFGNRLKKNQKNTEMLYEYYVYEWKDKFVRQAKKKSYSYCLQLDIKSYYTNINQKKLFNIIINLLPDYKKEKRLKEFLESLIFRNFKGCEEGFGIPQGSIISGILANIYLKEIDDYIINDCNMSDKYLRYVDDILIFSNSKDKLSTLKHKLDNKFKEYNLELHGFDSNKTKLSKKEVIINQYKMETKLEKLDDRLEKVLNSFYSIRDDYYQDYKDNPNNFLIKYKDLLSGLGINISIRWLNRKLSINRKRLVDILPKVWGKQWLSKKIYYKFSVTWPESWKMDKAKWIDEFKRNNKDLIEELEIIRKQLNENFKSLYYKNKVSIEKNNLSNKKAIRKLKFYSGKVGILYCNQAPDILKECYNKIWYIKIKSMVAYEGLYEKILEWLKKVNRNYIEAILIWIIGEIGKNKGVNLLYEILSNTREDENNIIILLSLSEALLKIDYWDNITGEELIDDFHYYKTIALRKNIYLILGRCNYKKNMGFLNIKLSKEKDLLLKESIRVAQSGANVLANLDILPNYLETKKYPAIEPTSNDTSI